MTANRKLRALTSIVLMVLLAIPASNISAGAVGPATSFQGRLQQDGQLYTGTCTITLYLYDALTSGTLLATSTHTSVSVSNGEFTVYPDWGDQWNGTQRWVEVAVQCTGDGSPTTLSPRSELTATPYSSYAIEAPWSGVTGKPSPCPGGQAVIDFAGNCGAWNTYTAGYGLVLTGTAFSVVTTTIQTRVSGTCAAGTSIASISQTGTVTCETDDNSGGTITGTATANQIALWSGTSSLTGTANFIWNNGTLTISGTKVLADFSSASRLYFQSQTTNGATYIQNVPNGTSTSSGVISFGGSDVSNAPYTLIYNTGSASILATNKTGTGSSTLPLAIYMYGAEKARMTYDGAWNVGRTDISGAGNVGVSGTITVSGDVRFDAAGGGLSYGDVYNTANIPITTTNQSAYYAATGGTPTTNGTNNITASGTDPILTATYTGVYAVTATANFTATASASFQWTIQNSGGGPSTSCTATKTMSATANALESVSMTCIQSITAGQSIGLAVKRTDAAGGSVRLYPSSIMAVQVGR